MSDIGMMVGGPFEVITEISARAEKRGFSSLWVAETARTAFIQAAVALQATTRARVGTAIALAFPRSPVITAMTARDLAELSGGRFSLGLGTQVKRVNELRYSTHFEHPAPKMREAIEVCRAVWGAFDGRPINYEGKFYTVTMPPFPGAAGAGAIPVGVAAVNEKMVGLAGEICDEFLGHPFSSVEYFNQTVRPAMEAGAAKAGRDVKACRVVQSVIASVSDDPDEAIRNAKMQIAFYGTTRTYRGVFAAHGWEHMTDVLRDAFAKGDTAAMIDAVTDEMAESLAVFGTPDEARDRIKRWEPIADEIVLGPPWASPVHARTTDVYDALMETFSQA